MNRKTKMKQFENRRKQLLENLSKHEPATVPYEKTKRKLAALEIEINNYLVELGESTRETDKEREERLAWAKTGKTVWTRPDGLGRPTLGTAWDNKKMNYNRPDWDRW